MTLYDKQESIKINHFLKILIYLVLFSLILTPSFKIISGVPAIRIEEVISLFFVVLILLEFAYKNKISIYWNKRSALIVIFLPIIAISIMAGSLNGYNSSFGDFNQFIRIFKYLIIYIMMLTYIKTSLSKSIAKLEMLKYIEKLSVILFLVALQQYLNLFGLNQLYLEYINPNKFQNLINDYEHPRPLGMVGNPNELGLIFSIIALISLYNFSINKQKVSIIFFLINLAGIVITLSRTSLVSLSIASFVFVFLLLISTRKYNKKNLIFNIIMTSIFPVIIYMVMKNEVLYEKFFWRFTRVGELENDTSWVARINNWDENLQIIKDNFIIGVGPLRRASFSYAADNEWLLLMRSYGLLGIVNFLLLLLLPLKTVSNNKNKIFLFSLVVLIILSMIPSAVFHSLVAMPLILLIWVLFDEDVNQENS
ncbi:O-antigen ligase family protein [Planococcus ruber]|uniref:O-antigen ligase family protein n=1 Tax=Planococcus ruber TaxID=2027871 RepID=UPI001FEDB822|nr:O-antigen ligase family protein [Planococcus ruber]MCJ1908284.1 O-antigen ligase family protein [Planococcus ruber]